MLYLVGLGLGEGELSLNGLIAIKNSQKLFLENYTTPISTEYTSFLRSFGKELSILKRSDLEEDAKNILFKAKDENIALLVPGDPLIATTHHLLFIIAKNLNISIEILHSSSIFSAAIAESRLDIYKFGPTTTITNWSKNYEPTSFLENIERNLKNNQHTLVLFDIINNGERTLSINEALKNIKNAENKLKRKIISDRKVLVFGNISEKDQYVAYSELTLLNDRSITARKLCIIVPAELSFAEKELLELFE